MVGVAKNCGKTTTLNALLALAAREDRQVGVVSIGIDGETSDVLIGTPKPPIHLARGQWVVTAEQAVQRSTAKMEYVDSLGFQTPMGPVCVCRTRSAGEVVLAGIRHGRDLERAIALLESHGADLVLVDGAYGRVVAANGVLSDAVIVSTGAVLSEDIETIVASTAELVDRLSLPAIGAPWQRTLMTQASREGRALLGGPRIAPIPLPARSALVGLTGARELWSPSVEALAVPGLVSDAVLEELLIVGGERTLLVTDGTAVQCDPRLLGRLRREWEVRALRASPLVGISYNPTAIQGYRVDADALRDALAARWPRLVVFDPEQMS